MTSPVRALMLVALIAGEVGAVTHFWRNEVAEDREIGKACTSMRAGITMMLGRGLSEPANEHEETALRVDRLLGLAHVDKQKPIVPERPVVRRVHGLNFVPGPKMHCTVYVLTDPDPTSDRVIVRQYLDGQVHEIPIDTTF